MPAHLSFAAAPAPPPEAPARPRPSSGADAGLLPGCVAGSGAVPPRPAAVAGPGPPPGASKRGEAARLGQRGGPLGACGGAGAAARAGGARDWVPKRPRAFQRGTCASCRQGLGGLGSREAGPRGRAAAAWDQLRMGSFGAPRVGHGRCPAGGGLEKGRRVGCRQHYVGEGWRAARRGGFHTRVRKPAAVAIPRDGLQARPGPCAPVLLYCADGSRKAQAPGAVRRSPLRELHATRGATARDRGAPHDKGSESFCC